MRSKNSSSPGPRWTGKAFRQESWKQGEEIYTPKSRRPPPFPGAFRYRNLTRDDDAANVQRRVRKVSPLRRLLLVSIALLALLATGPLSAIVSGRVPLHGDWRTADRQSTGIAPDPALHPGAIVQVYAARAFSWRGAFGVHTWIALKPENADRWKVLEVLGWRARSGRRTVVESSRPPDSRWFGSDPELLLDLRGAPAGALIAPILEAAADYPHADRYEIWPGPNSNTFVAWVARRVDGLDVELPVTAIGKDYLDSPLARSTSGSGYQLNLGGLLGATMAIDEGLEFNLLGLSFGIDFNEPALKLPGFGRLGSPAYRSPAAVAID